MSKPARLSESHLWKELKEFYDQQGEAAWSSGNLPFFATNNPSIAKTYVDLFIAFLDDCSERGLLNSNDPITILELGGGMGRLAYLILVRLQSIEERLPVKVRYVLTDYAQSNIKYYREHQRFQPFIESGLLEISQLDAETGSGLDLPGKNPIFVIANYIFDSLSQDGFRVKGGEIFEALCHKSEDDEIVFSYPEAAEKPYDNEDYNAVLSHYAEKLGDTYIPFPIGPLRCLKWLSEISDKRMALVMADKGLRSTEDLLDFTSLPIQKHESGFSMSVNCHAIDTLWKQAGGTVQHSSPRENPLNIAFYCQGFGEQDPLRTSLVFQDQINAFGPLDYLDFRSGLAKSTPDMPLSLCLQLLRLSHWDAELLYELSNKIGSLALNAPVHQQREIYDVLIRCWNNFFSISDGRDVPFAVARVLACINQFEQSVGFYGESLRLYGEQAQTHHNIAICQFNIGDLQAAEASVTAALALDPQYDASKSLLIRITEESAQKNKLSP